MEKIISSPSGSHGTGESYVTHVENICDADGFTIWTQNSKTCTDNEGAPVNVDITGIKIYTNKIVNLYPYGYHMAYPYDMHIYSI